MIGYRDVTVRYAGREDNAVTGVTFTAERGIVTALVGPNGSGKSTLVRALLRRAPVAGGAIRIDGTDVNAMHGAALARTVAVVTQREETLFVRRVREYIALGCFPHRGRSRVDDDRAVTFAAERAGVTALLDRHTDALSGGEWQRVRIARALAQGGEALVLDEPTAFLDIAHEMQVFELAATLADAGVAVLLVSHQLNLVARFARTMVLLNRGKVVAAGAPPTVMRGDLLESVYGWPLVVTHDPAVGAPALVPLRRPG